MNDGIGRKLADELRSRASAKAVLQQAADRKSTEQKASDDAALASLVKRVEEEVVAFNQHAEQLTPLSLSRVDDRSPYMLTSLKQLNFFIEAGKLQITIEPGHAPLYSRVGHDANGYRYHHIGPNGTATNRESSENEIVDSLLRQACGL